MAIILRGIKVEVVREGPSDYRAHVLDNGPGSGLRGGPDLCYWTDSPCPTPGQALARLGEQLDADLIDTGWRAPVPSLDERVELDELRNRTWAALKAAGLPNNSRLELAIDLSPKLRIAYALLPKEVIPDASEFDREMFHELLRVSLVNRGIDARQTAEYYVFVDSEDATSDVPCFDTGERI